MAALSSFTDVRRHPLDLPIHLALFQPSQFDWLRWRRVGAFTFIRGNVVAHAAAVDCGRYSSGILTTNQKRASCVCNEKKINEIKPLKSANGKRSAATTQLDRLALHPNEMKVRTRQSARRGKQRRKKCKKKAADQKTTIKWNSSNYPFDSTNKTVCFVHRAFREIIIIGCEHLYFVFDALCVCARKWTEPGRMVNTRGNRERMSDRSECQATRNVGGSDSIDGSRS